MGYCAPVNNQAVLLHPRLGRAASLALLLPALACSGACGPNVPILMYHSVTDHPSDKFTISEALFTEHLDYLKSSGFNTVTLHELLEHEEHKAPLPPNPIVLTFDDGFQDNYSRVLPLLKARGQKATFFIVTRFCAHEEAHRRVENPGTPHEKRFMLWREVRAMQAAGMEIGSHSLFHKRMTTLSDAEIREDLRLSRAELEKELSTPIEFFAYPFNSERRDVRRLVEHAGYRAAVSGAHSLGDKYELARIGIYRGMTAAVLRSQLEEGWASSYTSDGR